MPLIALSGPEKLAANEAAIEKVNAEASCPQCASSKPTIQRWHTQTGESSGVRASAQHVPPRR